MADADDTESWSANAFRYAELAAHQIARFRNPSWNPTWHDLIPDDPFPALTIGWRLRGKRSRPAAIRTKREERSPATPLDFGSWFGFGSGSGASTSGYSSPEKRMRVVGDDDADVSAAGGCWETKSVGTGRAPAVLGVSAGKDIRRPGKKKTLCELQLEEKMLLEEKNMLQKKVEMGRKAYEDLKAENQKLKSQKLHRQSTMSSTKESKTSSSSASPSSLAQFLIPDLNEPLSENLD